MAQAADPNWLLEIMKIAVPVGLGALIWAGQTLAQRAWTEYEKRRDLYLDVVRKVDALFSNINEPLERREYLRAIRSAWIGGSDEVVRAANSLSNTVKSKLPADEREEAYRLFIESMRSDLRTRRWLPPGKTILTKEDFPIEGWGA